MAKMIVDKDGNRVTCSCGACVAVGDHALSGALVVWWAWADKSKGKATEHMWLMGICDTCRDTARGRVGEALEVIRRDKVAS